MTRAGTGGAPTGKVGGSAVSTGRVPVLAAPTEIDGLGHRAARGAAVTLGGQLTRMVLQLASVVVLARLLTPRDYGLMAVVLVVVGIGEIFRDFGLSTAAIQAKHLSREQRDGLFWINSAIGVGLTVATFVGAGVVSAVFHQPLLMRMTQVLALTFTVNGLTTQYRADLNRRMRFGALALSDVVGQAAGLVTAIVLAVLGAQYWALVAQQLVQVVCVLVLVGTMARWLPGWPRRHRNLGSFLRLGSSLMGTQLIHYVSNNLDTITIGMRFSSTSLGLYNRAFQLLMTPLGQLRSPATTVALPVLSRLQSDVHRAGEYLRRSQLAFGYTIVPAMALAAGAARPLIEIFLGEQWVQVAPVFALLAIAGTCQTLAFVGYWVYLSRGLGASLFRYTVLTFFIKLACILVGSTWGVTGVAAGYTLAAVVEWPLSLWWLSRITVIPVRDLLLGATRILSCAIPAGGVCFAVVEQAGGWPTVLTALAGLGSGVIVYGIAVLLSRSVRDDVRGVMDFLRRMVRRSP